ncbi:MAG TPA: DUF305 domain-containing protein [Candidatus Obscuribacterales bacterium]
MSTLKKPLLAIALVASVAVVGCANQASAPSGEGQPADSAVDSAANSAADSESDNSAAHAMTLGPKDRNFDLRFIDSMIPHHRGAVVMAREALEKSERPEIQTLAQSILDTQRKEIRQLLSWRERWYPDAGEEAMMWDEEMGHDMAMTRQMESRMRMVADLGEADDEFDLRFLNAMIPHHEGALVMAQEALEKSNRSRIQEMAQEILTTQQAEIDQMEQWQQEWYGGS